jgi:hypothetical protein
MNLKTATAVALTAWFATSTARGGVLPTEPPPSAIGYGWSSDASVTINGQKYAIGAFAGVSYFIYDPTTGIEWQAEFTLNGPAPYAGSCFYDTDFAGPNFIYANCEPPNSLQTLFIFADPLGNAVDNLVSVRVPMANSVQFFPATGSAIPGGLVESVPEPSSLTLLGAALGLLLVRRSFNGKGLSGQSV